jgi:hypothetical protein
VADDHPHDHHPAPHHAVRDPHHLGHDLPLVRITNVTYERSPTDRQLGCVVDHDDAAEELLTLVDIPTSSVCTSR